MPQYFSPGVYVEEVDSGPRPIQGVSTSVTGAVGVTQRGPTSGKPVLVTSFNEFRNVFGGFLPDPSKALKQKWEDKSGQFGVWWRYPNSVRGFFDNGGQQLYVKRVVSGEAKSSRVDLEKKGIIAEIVTDGVKGAKTLKLRHVIGVTGNSTQQVTIHNGLTGNMIGVGIAVAGYEVGATESTLYLDELSSGIAQDVFVDRGDYAVLVAAPAAPAPPSTAATLRVNANSEGGWGNDLSVRVRPVVSETLKLLFHQDAADVETGSGSLSAKSEKPDSGNRTLTLQPDHSLEGGDTVRILDEKYVLDNPNGAISAEQKIELNPKTPLTGGGIRLKFKDSTAATLLSVDSDKEIKAPEVQAALLALADIPAGAVNCTGGPLPSAAITVTFQGALADQAVPLIEVTENTLDPAAQATVTMSTPGHGDITFDVLPVTEDHGQDWGSGTPVQKLRKALKDVPDDTIYVSGAGRLYPGAMIELDNKKEKTFKTVSSVDGNKVTLGTPLDVTDTLVEDDNVLVIEAEVSARHSPPGDAASEELFTNLKLKSKDPDDPFLITNHLTRRSQLIVAQESQDDGITLSNTLQGFPGTGRSGFSKLDAGEDNYDRLSVNDFIGQDKGSGNRSGIKAMEDIEDISLVMAPGMWARSIINELTRHSEAMGYRMAVFDAPLNASLSEVQAYRAQFDSKYAAMYYPWIKSRQPGVEDDIVVPPSAHVVGIYADVDSRRGFHKAPANEVIRGITEINQDITRREQDLINPRGINALRFFPGRGNRVWGARTISSDANFRYINVRRIFNFIERSIDEGTQFVVFEPNDETLWARVRQTVGNFLNTQWRNGVLEGSTAEEAYFVECNRGVTMTQDDIENGRLIAEVGIAPVFPAEFVIFRIQKFTAESKLS